LHAEYKLLKQFTRGEIAHIPRYDARPEPMEIYTKINAYCTKQINTEMFTSGAQPKLAFIPEQQPQMVFSYTLSREQ
jgi:hypothetical protein